MSKGKYLEKLITVIEETLKPFEYFKVRHDVEIPDKNGINRQIDILIEVKGDPRFDNFRIIIETKNWNKKININTVGAFIDLLESTKVTKGIIVTTKGFQSGAKKKAILENSKQLLIYKVEETSDKELENWINDRLYEIKLIPIIDPKKLEFEFSFFSPPPKIDLSKILDDGVMIFTNPYQEEKFIDFVLREKNRVLQSALNKTVFKLLETFSIDKMPKVIDNKMRIKLPLNTSLKLGKYKLEIEKVGFTLKFNVEIVSSNKITKENYKEIDGDIKAEVVTAKFDRYNYVLVRNKLNQDERYFIIPKSSKGKTKEIYNLGEVKKKSDT